MLAIYAKKLHKQGKPEGLGIRHPILLTTIHLRPTREIVPFKRPCIVITAMKPLPVTGGGITHHSVLRILRMGVLLLYPSRGDRLVAVDADLRNKLPLTEALNPTYRRSATTVHLLCTESRIEWSPMATNLLLVRVWLYASK